MYIHIHVRYMHMNTTKYIFNVQCMYMFVRELMYIVYNVHVPAVATQLHREEGRLV